MKERNIEKYSLKWYLNKSKRNFIIWAVVGVLSCLSIPIEIMLLTHDIGACVLFLPCSVLAYLFYRVCKNEYEDTINANKRYDYMEWIKNNEYKQRDKQNNKNQRRYTK